MGMIFDIKRYAIHDGPGIRTTVFLKGCPLNCRWCHNPEGVKPEQELMWWAERCIGCRSCEDGCPAGALSFQDGSIRIDQNRCDLCGACVRACLPQALLLVGEDIAASRLVEEIEKDAIFYDQSGGGVTLSGGEPLMQPEFTRSILSECRGKRIHTVLDTCGYADAEVILSICKDVDLVLYDLKMIDPERHVDYTGSPNEPILRNLERLSRNGRSIVLRYPLIPGINDGERDIRELGEYLSSLESIPEVHLLQYHRAGEHKAQRFVKKREPFALSRVIPAATLVEHMERLRSYGLKVQLGA
jgi:pyruvate formate lyase activating enzyme